MMENTAVYLEASWSRPVITTGDDELTLLLRVRNRIEHRESEKRAPLDIAFVLDRSGSMRGGPIQAAKAGIAAAMKHLDGEDRAAVVIYDDKVDVLAPLQPMSVNAQLSIRAQLDEIEGRNSTDLCSGWLHGCHQLAVATADRPRRKRALLLTDGLANTGETNPSAIANHASELRKRGITTTTLGFGPGFDEHLLAAMAESGGGNFEYIAEPWQLTPFFQRELGEMVSATAIGATISVTLPPGLRGELLGALPFDRIERTFLIDLGDLRFEETIEVLFRITSKHGDLGDVLPVTAHLEWARVGEEARRSCDLELSIVRSSDDAVRIAPVDETVIAARAIWQASIDRRKAMELDRAGEHERAHAMIRQSAEVLASAPQISAIRDERFVIGELLREDWSQGLATDTHKRVLHRESRRVRGREVDRPE